MSKESQEQPSQHFHEPWPLQEDEPSTLKLPLPSPSAALSPREKKRAVSHLPSLGPGETNSI